MSVFSREMRSGKMLRASCIVIVEKPCAVRRAEDVAPGGAGDAHPVDAGVVVEALVLGDDERVAHVLRDLVELDERAALEPDLGDEAAVGGVELRRLLRRVLVEHLDRRTRAAATDERPAAYPRPATKAMTKLTERPVTRARRGRARQKRRENGEAAMVSEKLHSRLGRGNARY